MSNDAKLGLVVGVAIVLVIALVFFRSDALEASVDPSRAAAALRKAPTPRVHIPLGGFDESKSIK